MTRVKAFSVLLLLAVCAGCPFEEEDTTFGIAPDEPQFDPQATFRFDTFGDEALWTDVLRMHEVVMTISPETALAVGLKVDAEALPEGPLETADLTDPATTVELLRLDLVVGVQAEVSPDGAVTRFGITCALCHSDVDDSVAPGIGKRLDGWPAPFGRAFHRRAHAARGARGRCGPAVRHAHGHEALPHDAAARAVAAPAVLPQRRARHIGRRHRSLRPRAGSRADRDRKDRPGRIPEIHLEPMLTRRTT